MNSGIYCIQNIDTLDAYIGSTNNLDLRLTSHKSLLVNNKHHNPYLQNSFNKYGIEKFKFYILSKCPIEYLSKLEQWFIDNIKPEYNIALDTISFRRGKKNTLEHNAKIKESRKRNGVNERISLLLKGNKFARGQKRTKEEIDRLQKAKREKFIKKVMQISKIDGRIIAIHDTTVEAGKSVNLTYKAINKAIHAHSKCKFRGSCGGYYWKYIENKKIC